MIFLVGYYGFGNIGDEAILSAILAEFRARQPDVRFVVASGNPANTTAAHGVEAIAWNDLAAIHRAVQASDLVMIGGGGLFHDYWGVDPDTFLTNKHWGVAYYAGPALLTTLYRKRLMLYAVGIGPLYSAHGIKLTRMTAQTAQAITVRDPGSKTALEDMGIPAASIRVTADPAFAFQPTLAPILESAAGENFVLRRPVLAAAPRHWSIGVHPEFLERELAAAFDLFLEQLGGSVVLVPFQNLSGERENDRATATRILGHMRLRERAAIAGGLTTPDQVYACLKDCDIVFGMRLHALIFAATAGVPAVALSYDPKIDEIVRQLGLGQFSLDAKDVTAPELAALFLRALDRGGPPPEAAILSVAGLRKAALDNVSIAFGLLDAPPPDKDLSRESFDFIARGLFTGAQFGGLWQEAVEAAAREAARFAEDRDWLQSEHQRAVQQLAQMEQEKQAAVRNLQEIGPGRARPANNWPRPTKGFESWNGRARRPPRSLRKSPRSIRPPGRKTAPSPKSSPKSSPRNVPWKRRDRPSKRRSPTCAPKSSRYRTSVAPPRIPAANWPPACARPTRRGPLSRARSISTARDFRTTSRFTAPSVPGK